MVRLSRVLPTPPDRGGLADQVLMESSIAAEFVNNLNLLFEFGL